jgi:hypothetical protein
MSHGYLLSRHAFLWSSDLKLIFLHLHEAFIRIFDSFLSLNIFFQVHVDDLGSVFLTLLCT